MDVRDREAQPTQPGGHIRMRTIQHDRVRGDAAEEIVVLISDDGDVRLAAGDRAVTIVPV